MVNFFTKLIAAFIIFAVIIVSGFLKPILIIAVILIFAYFVYNFFMNRKSDKDDGRR